MREMGELSGVELKRARLVPSSVFASAEEVLRSGGVSRAQKIAILRRWEFDARSVAANPAVRHDGAILHQVREALAALGAASPGRPAMRDSLALEVDPTVISRAPRSALIANRN
jgi:hypothetical protein